MTFRSYDPDKDAQAVHRIWREVHWVKSESEETLMDVFLSGSRALVAEMNGVAECLAMSVPGRFRYGNGDLRLSAVTGVTTSRVARKQGFARRLAAELIAADAADGAEICALSMFEQGFYDRLGFGTGGYEHMMNFDPADLTITQKPRPPVRLTTDDSARMHEALLARKVWHGACTLLPSTVIQAETGWSENGFGLGYVGPNGELTHFFWGSAKDDHGPYHLKFIAYRTYSEFIELLALLKSLGDQVCAVSLIEPPDFQLQDLLRTPFRGRMITKKSDYEQHCRATAYWQTRICDLDACLAKTSLPGESVRFNLSLHDPVAESLPVSSSWGGIGGEYTITLGVSSHAECGTDARLPTLRASVGAFTRLWLGVRPASGLAATDDLFGPQELLNALDVLVHLPPPHLGWDF
ncbi:MAG: GNAT family N-acetyltransferase [candidate division Zixibacteria bacterium]|nr:GNAT family N-acetyltransferase [candidate division Zixibacteria bacterium]